MDDLKTLARAWAALPQFSNVRASGDGVWAFWCGAGSGEIEDVFAAPLQQPGQPEQLTFGTDHHQIRDVSPDGQRLILAQSRYASEHDHLLLLDRRTGNRLHLLTPKQDNHYLYGGELTRDGKAVAILAYRVISVESMNRPRPRERRSSMSAMRRSVMTEARTFTSVSVVTRSS